MKAKATLVGVEASPINENGVWEGSVVNAYVDIEVPKETHVDRRRLALKIYVNPECAKYTGDDRIMDKIVSFTITRMRDAFNKKTENIEGIQETASGVFEALIKEMPTLIKKSMGNDYYYHNMVSGETFGGDSK